MRLQRELGEHAKVCVMGKAAHAPHLERDRDATKLLLGFLLDGRIECPGRSAERIPVVSPAPAPLGEDI